MTITARGLTPLLEVFDMPASLRFYRDLIGFEVVQSSSPGDEADWVLLSLGDAHLMLNTAYESHERPAAPDRQRVRGHADTALFIRCPDVDGAYAQLRAGGAAVDPPAVRDYGMKQLYVTDPDGFRICFQWPVR